MNSMDLGWCEVCEETPATQQARYHLGLRICAACAESERQIWERDREMTFKE